MVESGGGDNIQWSGVVDGIQDLQIDIGFKNMRYICSVSRPREIRKGVVGHGYNIQANTSHT